MRRRTDRSRRAFAHWTQAQPAVSALVHALVRDRAERDDVLQELAPAVAIADVVESERNRLRASEEARRCPAARRDLGRQLGRSPWTTPRPPPEGRNFSPDS